MTSFYPKSPAMEQKLSQPKRKHAQTKYPWATVPVGQCFIVPCKDAKLVTLKSQASRKGCKLGRKFAIVEHTDQAMFEICCISEATAVQSLPKPVEGVAFDPLKPSALHNAGPVREVESLTIVGTKPDFGFDKG